MGVLGGYREHDCLLNVWQSRRSPTVSKLKLPHLSCHCPILSRGQPSLRRVSQISQQLDLASINIRIYPHPYARACLTEERRAGRALGSSGAKARDRHASHLIVRANAAGAQRRPISTCRRTNPVPHHLSSRGGWRRLEKTPRWTDDRRRRGTPFLPHPTETSRSSPPRGPRPRTIVSSGFRPGPPCGCRALASENGPAIDSSS